MSPSTMPTPAAPKPRCQSMVSPRYPQISGPKNAADVDAHVVDRKSRVAARAALGIQVADDRADVRLQQTGADRR